MTWMKLLLLQSIPFPLLASLNGVAMFGQSHDVTLLSTVTRSGPITMSPCRNVMMSRCRNVTLLYTALSQDLSSSPTLT